MPTGRPGRDRRATRHAAPLGRLRDDAGHRVVVVGGGIAGLSAATALAERGVRVTLLEREDQLGGRVRAWPVDVDGAPATMSRGFHAFFRQYYNLRALLRRADPQLENLRPVADYPLLSADGRRDSFTGLPRTPPWNMLAFVRRHEAFGWRELAAVDLPTALSLISVRFPQTFSAHDGQSAEEFLDRLHFPSGARDLALTVFSRSFFADPSTFAADELIAMFHAYFLGSAEGLLFDVPADDYDTSLWAPLGRYLYRVGVETRTGVEVGAVRSDDRGGVVVDTSEGPLTADAVVIATDLTTTQRLLSRDGGPVRDPAWRARLAALRPAPPFAVCRWWLERPARRDRSPFVGTAGFGRVDNVSLLDHYEDGARRWARDHGGSVVELHAYALDPGDDDAAVRAEMREVLDRVYPELAGAGVRHEQYLRRDDCPLVGADPWSERPGPRTPDPRVVLAGDGVRCALPVALMERAATTGFQAANTLLAGWGLAGHELWSVPMRGRLPRFLAGGRRFARGRAADPNADELTVAATRTG